MRFTRQVRVDFLLPANEQSGEFLSRPIEEKETEGENLFVAAEKPNTIFSGRCITSHRKGTHSKVRVQTILFEDEKKGQSHARCAPSGYR